MENKGVAFYHRKKGCVPLTAATQDMESGGNSGDKCGDTVMTEMAAGSNGVDNELERLRKVARVQAQALADAFAEMRDMKAKIQAFDAEKAERERRTVITAAAATNGERMTIDTVRTVHITVRDLAMCAIEIADKGTIRSAFHLLFYDSRAPENRCIQARWSKCRRTVHAYAYTPNAAGPEPWELLGMKTLVSQVLKAVESMFESMYWEAEEEPAFRALLGPTRLAKANKWVEDVIGKGFPRAVVCDIEAAFKSKVGQV